MAEYDAIVVGGGPAGAAAAIALAGHRPGRADRILIIDRARFPRPKLCGGGVSGYAEQSLAQLGVAIEVPSVPVRRVRFILPDQEITIPATGTAPIFRVVDRAEFDAALLDEARGRGVAVREGEAVTNLAQEPDAVVVRTAADEYRAELVIGADGSNSTVRRLLGLTRADRLASLLEILTPVVAAETPEFTEELAVFDFRPVAEGVQGYYWDFPTRRGGAALMNRGIFDARVLATRPRAALKPALAQSLAARGVALDDHTLHGHPERWFDAAARHSAPRVILAGDAAGADPLLGEGISLALAFGIFAAEAAAAALDARDFTFADYERRLRASRFGRTLRERRVAARAFYAQGASWRSMLGWWMRRLLDSDPDDGFPALPLPGSQV